MNAPERPRAAEIHPSRQHNRAGLAYGLAAYGFWGFLPLYFKAIEVLPATDISCNLIPGSFPAATLIAFVATAGEPAKYGRSPELPAEATTRMPRAAAAFDATAVRSVLRP